MHLDKFIENYYPKIMSYKLIEKARQAMQKSKVKTV